MFTVLLHTAQLSFNLGDIGNVVTSLDVMGCVRALTVPILQSLLFPEITSPYPVAPHVFAQ
jgi:hypothetical protein